MGFLDNQRKRIKNMFTSWIQKQKISKRLVSYETETDESTFLKMFLDSQEMYLNKKHTKTCNRYYLSFFTCKIIKLINFYD